MSGILDYQRYLNTLQSLSEIGNIFPTTQKTLTYEIEGGGTQGWTATITWSTLLVDNIAWSNGIPNFSNSTVIGYFPPASGSVTEYTNGVISIPANIYTGPLLPTATRRVPMTVVNVSWLKDSEEYSVNFGYMQNWEPGIIIGDPYNWVEFEPVDPIASTLTLTGTNLVIYGDIINLDAISDIPIDLGTDNICSFYANTATGVKQLIGESLFVDKTASLTTGTQNRLGTDTWYIYADFRGKRQYGRTFSNTLTLTVVPGVPLLTQTKEITPVKAVYYPGDQINFNLEVYPDPTFPVTGEPVNNSLVFKGINVWDPFAETEFFNGNFSNGSRNADLTIAAGMVDSTVSDTDTQWTILSYTTGSGLYTATVEVSNGLTVQGAWGYQLAGRYAAGSTSSLITVANTVTFTRSIEGFDMFLFSTQPETVYSEPYTVNLATTSGAYSKNITITAVKGAETQVIFSANSSGTDLITTSTSVLGTGTWLVTASYPGDIGDSIYWANAPFTSNTIEVKVRAGNDLGAKFTYWTTATEDVLNVWASTSSTVTNVVSFFDDGNFLGTATWSRVVAQTAREEVWFQGGSFEPLNPAAMYRSVDVPMPDGQAGSPYLLEKYALGSPGYDTTTINQVLYFNYSTDSGQTDPGYFPNRENVDIYDITTSNFSQQTPSDARKYFGGARVQQQGRYNPNRYRLWKYYDGTNYQLAGTQTDIGLLLDPITTGTWQTELVRSIGPKGTERNGIFEDLNAQPPAETRFTTFNIYDIYRFDNVGDIRGYNVIALPVNTPTPNRIYFKITRKEILSYYYDRFGNQQEIYNGFRIMPFYDGVNQQRWLNFPDGDLTRISSRTYYIDLVEYIGEADWQLPIQNSAQAAETEARVTKKLYFYRFTPEVRQSNTGFKTGFPLTDHVSRIPGNVLSTTTIFGTPLFDTISMSQKLLYRSRAGLIYRGSGISDDLAREQEYGLKYWNTRNIADPTENDYTDFCNAWFTCFGMFSFDVRGPADSNLIYSTATVQTITTITETTFSNTQTAQLTLPLGTVSTWSNLSAAWPGTLGLPEENGRFGPFDLTVDRNPSDVELTVKSFTALGSNPGMTTATQLYTDTSIVYQTNPIELQATVTVDHYKYPYAITTGTLEFYNVATGNVFKTLSITTGTGSVVIDANTLTNSNGSVNIPVTARFYATELDNVRQDSASKTIQTIRNSSMNMVNLAFTSTDYYYKTNNNLIPGIIPNAKTVKVAEITKASTGLTLGPVYVKGGLTVLLPYNNVGYRAKYYNPFGTPLYQFIHYSQGPMFVDFSYRLNNTGDYLPLRQNHPTYGVRLSFPGGAATRIISNYSNNTAGPSSGPIVKSVTFNDQIENLTFDQAWTSIQFYVTVWGQVETYPGRLTDAAYNEFVAAYPGGSGWLPLTPYSGSAAIPQHSKFGYTQNISIGNS